MKKFLPFLLVGFILTGTRALAWGLVGHQVVAAIAWSSINDDAKREIEKLLAIVAPLYPVTQNFVTAATWPDLVKNAINAWDKWHYTSLPVVMQPVNNIPPFDETNIVWAVNQASKTLQITPPPGPPEAITAINSSKAFMLLFLIHLIGDAHQPLHAVNYYSPEFPQGDDGGNLYQIFVDKKETHLHWFWDAGGGYFESVFATKKAEAINPKQSVDPKINELASKIIAKYPAKSFGARIAESNVERWVEESYALATNLAYTTKPNVAISSDYRNKVQDASMSQVALAGYREANFLNQLFGKKQSIKSKGPSSAAKTIHQVAHQLPVKINATHVPYLFNSAKMRSSMACPYFRNRYL